MKLIHKILGATALMVASSLASAAIITYTASGTVLTDSGSTDVDGGDAWTMSISIQDNATPFFQRVTGSFTDASWWGDTWTLNVGGSHYSGTGGYVHAIDYVNAGLKDYMIFRLGTADQHGESNPGSGAGPDGQASWSWDIFVQQASGGLGDPSPILTPPTNTPMLPHAGISFTYNTGLGSGNLSLDTLTAEVGAGGGASVPVPGTIALAVLGLAGLRLRKRLAT